MLTAVKERSVAPPIPGLGGTRPAAERAPSPAPAKKPSKKKGEDDEPEEAVASEGPSAVTPPPAKMSTSRQSVGGYRFTIVLFSNAAMPEIQTVGDAAEAKLKIGGRTYWCDGAAVLAGD
jgi:hypothetical protein